MEFVELEELLPANQTTSSLAKHESIISIDRRSQTLKFDKDKVKEEKVDTLAKWMLAWNTYMQAYLHYHPQAYFELFSYQMLICQLANRYKFKACVQYDTNFRLSMANQQTPHADLRSVLYLRVGEEYKSQYLMDHPCQWHLLCFYFHDHWYVDLVLSFGLRSSPTIFCQFADLVRWVLANCYNIPMIINYSDDFFQVSGLDLTVATTELSTVLQAFDDMGIPVASNKVFGPAHRLPYLGIVIDSLSMTMEVTEERYQECMTTLPRWLNRSKCTKTQLRSLIGKLAFVAKVVRPVRLFLRRLIDLSKTVKKGHHHISLNSQAQADIAWWYEFLPTWSKSSLIPQSREIYNSDLMLFSDASDLGFGAIYGTAWIQDSWSRWKVRPSIDYRELFAIVAAAETWGHNWEGKRIVFVTDNQPITQIWDKGSTPTPDIMSLVRILFLSAAKRGYSVSLKFISGSSNKTADVLSRFQDREFRQLLPDADASPTLVPSHIWPT